MGYETKYSRRFGSGHTKTTFHPDDTRNSMYIAREASMEEIWNKAQEKWPGIQMSELKIEAEHIQTDCIGHDQYDSMDYTNFLCLTASESYFQRVKK